ncbi:alpha/beta fold hydrolase [Mycolicibacterium hodleri]|uniref:alpha/beta fold hydrolase n=1 Tax=Mycolicibacterium hodleri TaxID=49897 RepID=UPI001F38C7BC|nr:alpha/beta hydrolase [Mycolicibacterium hodleri]
MRLYAQDVGAGPPVVLLAGFGMDHRVWDRQVRILSKGHRVICVDQRGHGRSEAPLTGYDVDRLAQDLLAVLDDLVVGECTLVGWSFGGQVAFRAAASDPDRIAKLILVGSNAVRASRSDEFPFGRLPEQLEPALVAAEHANRMAARRQTITSGLHRDIGADVVDWLLRASLQMPSWAAVACYHSMLTTDLIADIPRITMPVLQIIGAADPVHSAKGARWLTERLATAELLEIADCGHYPMLEAPDDFDAALTSFVEAN